MDNDTVSFFVNSWSFLNSNFVQSLLGACAGAYGAQFIIERKNTRETILSEIRNTNAAIMLAFDICNSSLNFKRQSIKSLKETFDKQQQELNEYIQRREQGLQDPNIPFDFQANLNSIFPITLPVEKLQEQLFERVSVTGRALVLTSVLVRNVVSLNEALNNRNRWIERVKNFSEKEKPLLLSMYFGLPMPDMLDASYPSTLVAISYYTDDIISYGLMLCDDLHQHGVKLSKRYGANAPKIHKPNFENLAQSGLIPDKKLYTKWNNMFQDN